MIEQETAAKALERMAELQPTYGKQLLTLAAAEIRKLPDDGGCPNDSPNTDYNAVAQPG